MTQIGKIKTIENGQAIVRVVRKGACGDNCSMCGACKVDPIEVTAQCEIEALSGDLVEIASAGNVIVGGLICLFILPIILPILAYVAFENWLGNVAAWIAAGIVLLICFILIFLLSRNSSYLKKAQPKVIRVVKE